MKRGQRVQYKVGPAPDGALTGKGELGTKNRFLCQINVESCAYTFIPFARYFILFYIITTKTHTTAYDLTYEGGELVPPFQKDYLESFIKKQKAIVSMMNVYILFTYDVAHTHTGDFIHGQFYFLTTFCFLPDMIKLLHFGNNKIHPFGEKNMRSVWR